ncbi:MAG: T9SS type A sorting domain-containing protein [Candidatus Marinimicrobia bacterium]|nr:T9SS type A sorting domain-containing protein [Candidatus Neomarinimicrobiota bacterium]
MLNQLHKSLVLVLIVFFSTGWGQEDTTLVAPEIPLDVFGGVGSVLLVWAIPESVAVQSVTIYRGLNPDTGFISIADLSTEQTRYLDEQVEPGIHYFYRVDVITGDGHTLVSSWDTPPFTRTVEDDEHVFSGLPVTTDSIIYPADYFVDTILLDQIIELFPEVGLENNHKLLEILTTEQIEDHTWFERFPLKDFSYFEALNRLSFIAEFVRLLEQKIDNREAYLRNHFLLTPDEWQTVKTDFITPLPELFDPVLIDYLYAQSLISESDPVRVVSLTRDSSAAIQLELIFLKPGELRGVDISIIAGNSHYPLSIDSDLRIGTRDTLLVQPGTEWVTLEVDGNALQQFSTISGLNFICSLNDEYLLKDSVFWDESSMIFNPAEVFINELIFLLDDSRISVEVSGKADSTVSLGLFMNDSLVIDLSYFNQEHEYQTYSWLTDNSLNSGWVSLAKKVNDSTWKIIESRPVDLTRDNFEARIPDGGRWVATSFGTLGDPNDLTRVRTAEIAIPEVFALYQNYPNPFNAKTTIAFDLLQSATINLFITDATGRKIDVFLQDIPSEPGNYQYSWDGHGYSSGVYFVTIQAQIDEYLPVTFSRKMIYLK